MFTSKKFLCLKIAIFGDVPGSDQVNLLLCQDIRSKSRYFQALEHRFWRQNEARKNFWVHAARMHHQLSLAADRLP